MGNYTKVNLLLLSVIAFLMSFTAKEKEIDVYAYRATESNTVAIYSETFNPASHSELKIFSNSRILEIFLNLDTPQLKAKLAKQKKKYKRLNNSFSSTIQPPVKELEPAEFNIFWKNSYSKPYFLSHIHSFVFRLTPF